jgi:hypothetical protein
MEEAAVEAEAGEELADQLEEGGEKSDRPERGERGERGGRGD